MRRYVAIVIVLIVLIAGGLSAYFFFWRDGPNAVMIPISAVPEPLVRKARETLPEVTFDHARKLPNGNYEVRGKTQNGKIREVEMNAAGEVVEIE